MSEEDHSPEPSLKRRKLRKGTSSCWECKRRKARCTFAEASDVCIGCTRRGTACISQDLPDEPAPSGNRHLVDRLGQVEVLLGRLVEASDGKDHLPRFPASAQTTAFDLAMPYLSPDWPNRFHDVSAPTSDGPRARQMETYSTTAGLLDTTDAAESEMASEKYAFIRLQLLAAWPTQPDIDVILSIPGDVSPTIRRLTALSYNYPEGSDISILPSPKELLTPPLETHPTLIAQRMLLVAAFLQGLPRSTFQHLEALSVSRRDTMTRIVDKVHNLVTCDDSLVENIEGIDCIFMEALYKNYEGTLRRAWLCARRGITMAQFLDLHKGARVPSLAAAEYRPDQVWFRLVQFDRYLSMTLGLPLTTMDESFAQVDVLELCYATERMQRINAVAAGRMLRRPAADVFDRAKTNDIDKLMRRASASLPPQWWVNSTLASKSGSDMTVEMPRFNGQLMHYHLLLHLHLPFLLHPELKPEHEYNRMTAVTASREILTRLLMVHSFHSLGEYCRGVDLLSFTASTALGLAHLVDANRTRLDEMGSHFLAHQRLNDRGLLEHTLELMLHLKRSGDGIATTVATLLEHLLSIEEDMTAGAIFTASLALEMEGAQECAGEDDAAYMVRSSRAGACLDIRLPHMPAIRIERTVDKSLPPNPSLDMLGAGNGAQAGVEHRGIVEEGFSAEGALDTPQTVHLQAPGFLGQPFGLDENGALPDIDLSFLAT